MVEGGNRNQELLVEGGNHNQELATARNGALRLARKAWAAAVKSGGRDLMFRARHAHPVLKVWE